MLELPPSLLLMMVLEELRGKETSNSSDNIQVERKAQGVEERSFGSMLCWKRAVCICGTRRRVTAKRHSQRSRRSDLLIPNKNDIVCSDQEVRLPGVIDRESNCGFSREAASHL